MQNTRFEKIIEEADSMLYPDSLSAMSARSKGAVKFRVYLNDTFTETDLSDLDMSVRSYNCLKRRGFNTVGELVDGINSWNDLFSIRNLGKKSAVEIMKSIFAYNYSLLPEVDRAGYLEELKNLNV